MIKGKVHILTGKVSCGKSTYARNKIDEEGGVHLSLDAMMLAIYGPQITRETIDTFQDNYQSYQKNMAVDIVNNGVDVFLDWGLWKAKARNEIVEFFAKNNIESTVYYFDVDIETRLKRNAKRNGESDCSSFKIEEKDLFIFDQFYEEPNTSENVIRMTN